MAPAALAGKAAASGGCSNREQSIAPIAAQDIILLSANPGSLGFFPAAKPGQATVKPA